MVILGEWDQNAKAAIAGDTANTLTATGTTNADALPLPAGVNLFTTVAANAGTILKNEGAARKLICVVTGATGPLKVYPPVGGTINGLAANAPISIAVTKSALLVTSDGMTWVSVLSA
jgi:hypothetical protein